jgi:hydrogenase maturation protease
VSEPSAAPLAIGIGDPARGDDGVGPWLAAALRAHGVAAVAEARDGAALAALVEGRAAVVLLDATSGAGAPGTLTVLDLARHPLPAGLSPPSSHLIGLAEGIGIARALGTLPPRALFLGIEGAAFGLGQGLSQQVADAAAALLPRLLRLLQPPAAG